MKKCMAIILAVLMLLPLALPMTAQSAETITPTNVGSVPSVTLTGDGDNIYDADGNRVYRFDEILVRKVKIRVPRNPTRRNLCWTF